MEQAIELFAAVYCTVIGCSHIIQPRAWCDFFIWLRGLGKVGAFIEGFLSLAFGAVIVGFHNVWTGWPIILTLVGWGQVLKGAVRFLFPAVSNRLQATVKSDDDWKFRVAGAILVALGCLFGVISFR